MMGATLRWLACVSLLLALPAHAGDEPAARLEALRAGQATGPAPAEPEPARLEDHLARGDAQREQGDHPRALWAYLLAHRLDRDDPRPIARIGTLHLTREPERAEAIFRELVHRGEDPAIARTGLGLALMARGSWSEAAAALREALDEDDALAAAHNALGVALDRQGQAEEARTHYRRAAELQPRGHEPLNNLGVSLLAGGAFAEAAAAFEAAARIEPRDAAVWNNLGVARGRLGAYDAALAAFRRAGDERAAQNNLGWVHYLNGDYDGALTAYERALHAAGKPEDRLPVLRNARAAQAAKTEPAPAKPLEAD
jgi:tetratricopeptide (TPR) repeat protein